MEAMLKIAIIQSTGANRIEGIYTSDERLDALVKFKAAPRNPSEREIAGYQDVLRTIHESYDYVVPRTNVILQLHRDLYQFSPVSNGGKFKNTDNIIAETDSSGHRKVRFQPGSAAMTGEKNDPAAEKIYMLATFPFPMEERRFYQKALIMKT